jgi:predicted RNA binding protein YcfA (HicA-like mRNA interferase family)
MKLPRDLSGRELANGLCKHWKYREAAQEGSHLLLITDDPSHQRIAIPLHRSVKVGTLNNILRAVAAHKSTTRETILKTIL